MGFPWILLLPELGQRVGKLPRLIFKWNRRFKYQHTYCELFFHIPCPNNYDQDENEFKHFQRFLIYYFTHIKIHFLFMQWSLVRSLSHTPN